MMIRKFDICADRLVELLAAEPHISVNRIAAQLDVDRTTVYRAIWYLQYMRRIEIEKAGRGRIANRYKIISD